MLRQLADASPAALLLLSPVRDADGRTTDFRIIDCNQEAAARLGVTDREVSLLSSAAVFGEPTDLVATATRVLSRGTSEVHEVVLGDVWYEQRWTRCGEDVTCSIQDVTSWHRKLDAHADTTRFLDSIIENVPTMIFLKDARELRFARFNKAGEELLGLTRERLIGRNDYDFFPAEQARFFQDRDQETLRSGKLQVIEEEPIQTAHGPRWLHTMKIPVRNGAGEATHLLGISLDITEKRQQDAALRMHSIILGTMSEGVCLIRTSDFTVQYANRKFEQMTGYAPGELIGVASSRLNGEEQPAQRRAEVLETIRHKGEANYESRVRCKDGPTIWCRIHTSTFESPEHGRMLVSVHEDITQQREMQARLALEDRLASLGRLAAGVAHEVNNPLTYVKTNVELVGEDVSKAIVTRSVERLHDVAPMLDDVREGIDRIRQIVRNLLTFSRADEERRMPLDVRLVLDLSLKLVAQEIRPRAHVVKEYGDVPPVFADEMRLQQVFVNLLANAADFIPEGRPRENEVRVRTKTEGDQVVIEVEDTGQGISPELLPQVFDPFFTTKPIGEGTGLGLAICHGIVKALAGKLEVRSEVGKGSTFRVLLPAMTSMAQQPAPGADVSAIDGPRRRVLVVDDEVQILKAVRLTLARHDVVTLSDAREALELLLKGESFDLILCDLMMPSMSGMELFSALQRHRPELVSRVVFTTAGAFTAAGRAFLDSVPNVRLEKPFTHTRLRSLLLESGPFH